MSAALDRLLIGARGAPASLFPMPLAPQFSREPETRMPAQDIHESGGLAPVPRAPVSPTIDRRFGRSELADAPPLTQPADGERTSAHEILEAVRGPSLQTPVPAGIAPSPEKKTTQPLEFPLQSNAGHDGIPAIQESLQTHPAVPALGNPVQDTVTLVSGELPVHSHATPPLQHVDRDGPHHALDRKAAPGGITHILPARNWPKAGAARMEESATSGRETASGLQRAGPQTPPPAIHVTIGRVDVQVAPIAAALRPRVVPQQPRLSLEDYLKRRGRRVP